MSQLIDIFWPSAPPRTAANIIQGHITRLRHILGTGLSEIIPRCSTNSIPASYKLETGQNCRVDCADFAALVADGDEAAVHSETDRAAENYERALRLWRGGTLADLDCLQDDLSVIDLNRRRSDVVLRLANIVGMSENHDRALPHLREACQREPLSEPLHIKLISALGGTGCRSEAVHAFDGLRKRLSDELGISPSTQLWRTYQQATGVD